MAIGLICAMICIEFGGTRHAQAFAHTNPSVDVNCQQFTFSSDGNPFPLCPGPYPGGGNCVWWAWEQWHLLGYNLPLNWGNAAEWIVDAERFGLPVGTQPRLASIAVFPVADGVWAFGTAGHVAFVTWVSQDRSTFNVTYQNYGDPTPMFTGTGYNVSYINQPRFQNGQMRFIYFPGTIDPNRFSHLPGIDSSAAAQVSQVAQVTQANQQLNNDITSGTASRIALDLPPGAYDQEFHADFTGSGLTDLLLYNRQQGSLDILTFTHHFNRPLPHLARSPALDQSPLPPDAPGRVSLGDATTPVDGWGSSLDIAIGDFSGSGHDDILLYDRASGSIQLLSLTPQLTIKQHVVLPGWGPGWEFYVGQLDGMRSDLFMYNRLLVPNPTFLNPTPTLTTSPSSNPTAEPTGTSGASSSPTVTPSPTVTGTPTTPTPSPSATASPSPTPTTTVTATPTTTPTTTPGPTTTPTTTPTVTPSPSPTTLPTPTPTVTATPSPSPSATQAPSGSFALSTVPSDAPQKPAPGGDLSGMNTTALQNLQPSPPPNILLLSFTGDLHIKQQQAYTLMHDSWEVYIGRFASARQDGLFLYDRTAGEARIMDFTGSLLVNHYQPLTNLSGNWDIHTGDFNASGRAQVLLYDPGTGDLQFLVFAPDLSLLNQVDNSGLNTGQVLYVGHFGLPALSVMLYDPVATQSTFISFDPSLQVAHQITVSSWDQRWQILIGAFQDRSTCQSAYHCATVDDLLLLNRQTGRLQQYSFTFGNQYQIFDNRLQAFIRAGVVITARLQTIDTSSFTWQANLDATITTEELY